MNQPCLPVPRRRKRDDDGDQQGASFENIESMDAMEYMAAVVQQANAMPEFFVAEKPSRRTNQSENQQHHQNHVPIEGSAASLKYLVSDRTAVLPPPTENHTPGNCRAWVDGTLSNFSVVREYLTTCQRQGVGGKLTERTPVPPMRDEYGWNLFCVGHEEAARGHVVASEAPMTQDTKAGNEPAPWSEVPPTGHEPSVELLLQLDQVMVRRVLPHLTLHPTGYSHKRTAWLYALLSRLERPIHRDDAATLYGLLKDLALTRKKLDPSSQKDELARINVLICIVGLYFEQGGGFDNVFSS